MSVIFTATHTCERIECQREYKWNCFEQTRRRTNDLTPNDIESLPAKDRATAHLCEKKDDGTYYVEVNCPYCDFDNHFTYNSNK